MPSYPDPTARPKASNLWLVLGAAALACGGDAPVDTTPTTGTITVTTATSGVEQDADGYTFQIDAGPPVPIGVSGSLETTGIVAGEHSVLLAGVAANCTAGNNPRAVTLAAGQGATVAFEVTCTATTGSLQVSASTTGAAPDADGYSLTVDGTDRGALAVGGALTVAGLAPGEHLVGLSGVAGNCQPFGANPRAVTVTAGTSINAAFTVACAEPAPDAGSLQVATITLGPDPDPNGYTVAVDGSTSQPIGVAARATVTNVPAGEHTVRLTNVAGNCRVEGDNPRPISVPGGATAELSFTVACTAITGSVKVDVTTTGTPTEPDGYTAKLDGSDPGLSVPPAGSITFTAVSPGSRTVALTEVAANCSVTGGESQGVTVTAGAQTDLSFAVTCAATTGSIQVTTVATGTSLDPDGYLVSVDGGAAQTIDNNASLTVGGLAPGAHSVALTGTAANCQLTGGPSPASVTVTAGVQAAVTFALDCPGTGVTRWTPMSGGGTNELVDVWGTGQSDVFAVGAGSDGAAVILHYNGAGWSEQMRKPYPFGPSAFNGVWANTPTDVYAVGILVEEGATGSVYHYDGSGWTPMTLPRAAADDLMYGVWGLSGTEIFAFGVYQSGVGDYAPLILRYDGTAWQTFPVPEGDMYISDMWGTSPTDLYAAGGRFESPSQVVMHYNGSSWSIVREAPGQGAAYSVWGSSVSDVFVGQATPPLLHSDGASWSAMTVPSTAPVFSLWGFSSNDVFATSGGSVLHYDGAAWTSTPPLTPHRLLALWGSAATDVFVVGENGTILHGTQ